GSDVLWTKLRGPLAAYRRLCRQDSSRGEAWGHPGRAADQVRSHHQSDGRKGAWPDNFGIIPPPRRRGDRMKRRAFITLLGGAAAWPLAARAQYPAIVPTVAFFVSGTPSSHGLWFAALVERLRELGWIENRTVAIEYRFAQGRQSFVDTMGELIRPNADVLVTNGTDAALVAKQATS